MSEHKNVNLRVITKSPGRFILLWHSQQAEAHTQSNTTPVKEKSWYLEGMLVQLSQCYDNCKICSQFIPPHAFKMTHLKLTIFTLFFTIFTLEGVPLLHTLYKSVHNYAKYKVIGEDDNRL